MKPFKPLFMALMLNLCLATSAFAVGPWSIFGDAGPVKEGLKPNPWCIELSSTCPEDSQDCLENNAFTYGGVNFKAPNKKLTFRAIHELSTSYKIKEGDCGGGSPRFAIGIDTDGDGKVNGHVFAYVGPVQECDCADGDGNDFGVDGHVFASVGPTPPVFAGCPAGVWERTGNLIHSTDARFEITELVPELPIPYMTYNEALCTLGDLADKPVLYVMLITDGGWLANQVILVDNVKVNNFKMTAKGYGKKRARGTGATPTSDPDR